MRNWINPLLQIDIERNALRLSRVEPAWKKSSATLLAQVHIADDVPWSAASMALRLRELLAAAKCDGMRTRVVLADDLVRYFTVTPPKNARRLADCRAAAAMRFQALYGEAPGGWTIEADWHAHEPFIACAIPTEMTGAISAAVAERQVSVTELVPEFVAAWNGARKKLRNGAWLILARGNDVTVGAIHEARLRAIRSLSPTDETEVVLSWLPQRLCREALLLGLPAPTRIIMTGDMPAGWTAGPIGTLVVERLDATQRPLAICTRSRP